MEQPPLITINHTFLNPSESIFIVYALRDIRNMFIDRNEQVSLSEEQLQQHQQTLGIINKLLALAEE